MKTYKITEDQIRILRFALLTAQTEFEYTLAEHERKGEKHQARFARESLTEINNALAVGSYENLA